MKRRVRPVRTFMGRVLGLVTMVIVLYALVTTLLYIALSRPAFELIKAGELEPKLANIVDMIEQGLPEGVSARESGISVNDVADMRLIKQLNPDLLDAYVLLVNSAGESLYNNAMPERVTPGMLLGTHLEKVLGGESVMFSLSMPAWRIDVLAVGGPAWGLWALWHRRKRRSAWERPLRPGLAPWKLAVCPAYVVAAAALLARLVLS